MSGRATPAVPSMQHGALQCDISCPDDSLYDASPCDISVCGVSLCDVMQRSVERCVGMPDCVLQMDADIFPIELSGLSYVTPLGSGSTAMVALYEHRESARWVAVKLCRRPHDALLNDLFRNEAACMRAINDHPHILPILGSGVTDDGRGYIICEYAPNGTLDAAVKAAGLQCGMPVDQIAALGVHMADALAAAHSRGIVHHDVKPSNIVLSASDKPMLADFGIADSVYASSVAGYSTVWAAPECFDVHARYRYESADVYSLAAVVYALLTGSPPSGYAGSARFFDSPVSAPDERNAPPIDCLDVPDALKTTLRIALNQNPEQRYFSALDFAHALQDVQRQCFGEATPLYVEGQGEASDGYTNHTPATKRSSDGGLYGIRKRADRNVSGSSDAEYAQEFRHTYVGRNLTVGMLIAVALLSLYMAIRMAAFASDVLPAVTPLQVVKPDGIENRSFSYHTDIAITDEV